MTNNLTRPAGFRHCRVYRTNSFGLIYADDEVTPYEGVELVGPKTLSITKGGPRPVSHMGADRLLAQDVLPPTDVSTAELTANGQDLTLEALVSGVNVVTQGEMKVMGQVTDKQGAEPFFAIIGFSQAMDGVTGARQWDYTWLPLARIITAGRTRDENELAMTYNVFPQIVRSYPYGPGFTLAVEGFTQAQYVDGVADYYPHVAAYLADGIVSAFTLVTDAVSTAKMKVYKLTAATGVITDETSGLSSLTVSTATFTTPPAAGDFIYIWYEKATL